MAVSLYSEAAIVVSELRETPDSSACVLSETWCTGRAHAGLGGGLKVKTGVLASHSHHMFHASQGFN